MTHFWILRGSFLVFNFSNSSSWSGWILIGCILPLKFSWWMIGAFDSDFGSEVCAFDVFWDFYSSFVTLLKLLNKSRLLWRRVVFDWFWFSNGIWSNVIFLSEIVDVGIDFSSWGREGIFRELKSPLPLVENPMNGIFWQMCQNPFPPRDYKLCYILLLQRTSCKW